LTLVVHTGNNPGAAAQQLKMLKQYKVDPSVWVWAHAHQADQQSTISAAEKGAWISLDGVNDSNVDEYTSKIEAFKKLGLLGRILLSHDGNSFPRGRAIRKFEAITDALIPRLKELGYSDEDINLLMIENPRNAFGIKILH
jgi:phosphotriesterase-related protein